MLPARSRTRRRRGRWGRTGLAAGLTVLLLLTALVLDSHAKSPRHPPTAHNGKAGRRAANVRPGSRRARAASKLKSPLTTPSMRQLIDSRKGSISVAVQDLRTGQEWRWNPGARDQTASIMKVDILETLLHRAMETDTPLSDDTADLAQAMIENSSDTAAQTLWDGLGGSSGVGGYNKLAGLGQTKLNTDGYWGESQTSATDQVRLLRELVKRRSLLDSASRRYELGLMEHVESDQDWGVSAGVPAGVSIALKNGWVPLASGTDWEINSIGRIKGDERDYLVAVLTAHDPSQGYGIATIESISRLLWPELAPGT